MRLLLYAAATHASSNLQTTTSRPPPGPPKPPPPPRRSPWPSDSRRRHGARDAEALEGLLLLRVTGSVRSGRRL